MKLARSNSTNLHDIGIGREITVGVHQNKSSLVVTRYMTEEELTSKRDALARQGKKVSFLAPFTCHHLPKLAVKTLMERKDIIVDLLARACSGEVMDEEECMLQLHLNHYLRVDGENQLAHLRTFWYSSQERKMLPHKRGVAISLEEMLALAELLDDLYDFLYD